MTIISVLNLLFIVS